MKRRAFTFGLAALAAAPGLPLSAATAAPATGITTQQFALAKLLARAHNHCTPDMLARHVRVSPEIAAQLQNMLLNQGVITPPIGGASMATSPLNTHCVPKQALKPSNLIQKASDLRKYLENLEQDAPKQAPDPAPETPSEAPESHA